VRRAVRREDQAGLVGGDDQLDAVAISEVRRDLVAAMKQTSMPAAA
jgi:hypothetical protein